MNFDPKAIIRSSIAGLKPYTPILPFEVLSQQLGCQPEDIIKLDANENPYGPSPLVAEVLAEAPYLHIYPDPESQALRAALADYTGVEAKYLLVGHGADELIDLIMRLFIERGDAIVNCPPTFGMYAFDADLNEAGVINIWRGPDFSIAIDEVEAVVTPPFPPLARGGTEGVVLKKGGTKGEIKNEEQGRVVKLIFITSPNNPDGSALDDETLKRLLTLPAVVVLDEAYVEFSGGSRIQWVKQYPNLIVLRTFSKWAGLAGLRVGYGAFPLEIIEQLWKIKQPYNVNVAGQLAAQASLTDRERLQRNVARIVAEREKFYITLARYDWLKPYPSQANFILCKVEGQPALEVKQNLTKQGILVRHYSSVGLADHLRFSIGTSAQMARLAEALANL